MPKHHALSKIDGHFNLQGSTRDNVIFHKGSWGECSVVIRVLSPTHDNRAAGCHRTRASEIACWPKRASSMRRKFCRSAGGQRMPKDGLDPHPIDSKLNHPSGNRHCLYLHCHTSTWQNQAWLQTIPKRCPHWTRPSRLHLIINPSQIHDRLCMFKGGPALYIQQNHRMSIIYLHDSFRYCSVLGGQQTAKAGGLLRLLRGVRVRKCQNIVVWPARKGDLKSHTQQVQNWSSGF